MDMREVERYCLLAKSARGKACEALVLQALSNPNLNVFGELLECPNVITLAESPDSKPVYDLLRIFAFGTYSDFKAQATSLPSLSEEQRTKLKQLSIVSLASRSRIISYSTLLSTLDCTSVRQLEDLIIDAIYKGLLKCKLDQQQQVVHVTQCIGRDVSVADIPRVIQVLKQWQVGANGAIQEIETLIQHIHDQARAEMTEAAEFAKQVESVRKQAQSQAQISSGEAVQGYDFVSPEYATEERRPKNSKMRPMIDRRPRT
eukprot:c13168_g3_i3.p1 GENE.c13168_g3_i3~~c13168_g3_i3.p1  ORF type:complete len:271 (+),score=47.52 c13168_g3_i3:36-815(+)